MDERRVPVGPDPVAAASVLVVADRPGLEVLLLHRRPESDFVGGKVVFPGGAVEGSDRSGPARGLVAGDVDADARRAGASLAHVVAAVRETLEETGLWLGTEAARPVAARRVIDAGERALADVAASRSIAARLLPHAGRWVTPPGGTRRYDTHFFVARADATGADLDALEPDGREVVDLEWATPTDALHRIANGALGALSPTVAYLEALANYDSVEAVIATARRGRRVDHDYAWTTI